MSSSSMDFYSRKKNICFILKVIIAKQICRNLIVFQLKAIKSKHVPKNKKKLFLCCLFDTIFLLFFVIKHEVVTI